MVKGQSVFNLKSILSILTILTEVICSSNVNLSIEFENGDIG